MKEPNIQDITESIQTLKRWEKVSKAKNKKAAVSQTKIIREQLEFFRDNYPFKYSK